MGVALTTPVAEGDPSASDGGTVGTGSRGGRGAKGDTHRQAEQRTSAYWEKKTEGGA